MWCNIVVSKGRICTMYKVENVVFMRKASHVQDLLDEMDVSYRKDLKEMSYTVVVDKKVDLTGEEYKRFMNDLLADRSWIKNYEQGFYDGLMGVILVTNVNTGEFVYVRSEGSNYPRYIGIPIKYSDIMETKR